MKRFLLILFFSITSSMVVFGQEGEDEGNEKIGDRMNEFIQKRLDLSKDEAEKFSPIFLRYFKEWRQTLKDNKGDKLELQHKIIELRLRYRNEFRTAIGERRGDRVFQQQDIFIRELSEYRNNRLRNGGNRPLKRGRR